MIAHKRRKAMSIVRGVAFALIPLAALAFTIHHFVQRQDLKKRYIEVTFSEGTNINPSKTRVLYKGVPVGMVTELQLSDDLEHATAIIRMEQKAMKILTKGSTFELINPKVSWEGVAGLETLISGSYINFVPNRGAGETARVFEGSTNTRVEMETEYFKVHLSTPHAESLSTGDAIFHRGVKVGQITKTYLDFTGAKVWVDAGIEPKFAWLVRANTSFWKKQGVRADLGLFGSDVRINSFDTIMKGGLEFATPSEAGPRVKYGHKFALLDDEPKDYREYDKWSPYLRGKKPAPPAKKGPTQFEREGLAYIGAELHP